MTQADSKNSITAPRAMASWFQGTIGDRRDILEGDDFRNRLVARVETPELADQMVAEHNAAVKAALLPVDTTRRNFLVAVGGGTAAMLAATIPEPAATAPASQLDPVFGLIEAHRTARAAYLVATAEQDRRDRIGDRSGDWIAAAQFEADIDAFNDLIETAATTFAGLRAWASYLDEIRDVDEDMLNEVGPTPALVVTLVEALGNLSVEARS